MIDTKGTTEGRRIDKVDAIEGTTKRGYDDDKHESQMGQGKKRCLTLLFLFKVAHLVLKRHLDRLVLGLKEKQVQLSQDLFQAEKKYIHNQTLFKAM